MVYLAYNNIIARISKQQEFEWAGHFFLKFKVEGYSPIGQESYSSRSLRELGDITSTVREGNNSEQIHT